MTAYFDRFEARGSGTIAFRLAIAGFPYEPVTHRDMEGTGSDGRTRAVGLSLHGVKLTQKADLVMATIEATGATFELADINQVWTGAFNAEPDATTWLNQATFTAADATMTVLSTAAFPSSGYLHIDQECIAYSGKTATTFTGCLRGRWDTLAAYHYRQSGGAARYPEVTSSPTVLEGRRCFLYMYVDGDDPAGDGTLIWRGMVKGEPRMRGAKWSIMVDPISAILDAEIGADLGEPVFPRGIYYPEPASFTLVVGIGPTGGLVPGDDTSTDDSFTIQFPDPLTPLTTPFFETQADFVAAVNDQITTNLVTLGYSADIQLQCVESVDGTYHFEFTPLGASYRAATVMVVHNGYVAPIEPVFERNMVFTSPYGADVTTRVGTCSVNTTYYLWATDISGGRGQVPRGVHIEAAGEHVEARRVYVGGTTAIGGNTTLASVDWSDGEQSCRITDSDTAERWIELSQIGPRDARSPGSDLPNHPFTPVTMPEIRLGREYGVYNQGTYGLMANLTSKAPEFVNLGAQPMVTSADWESASGGLEDHTWYDAYVYAPQYARQRAYASTDAVALKEVLCPDLQLIGHYLTFSASGKLTIRRLRLPSQTEVGTYDITRANLLTDNGMPSYERGAAGMFNTLVIRDGYDPIEDKYTLPPLVARDVTSYGRQPAARAVQIQLKSQGGTQPVTLDDAVDLADRVIGIFGYPYAYVTCEVPLTAINRATLGDPVSISTTLLPSGTGTRGVSQLMGLVTAREIDLYGGRIALTLLVTVRRIAGYAFGAKVSSQSNVSGNEWEIDVDPSYFADGTALDDFAAVGDRVRVYRFDSVIAGTVNGTVTLVSENTVRVAFDGVWTPGVNEWTLAFAPSSTAAASDNQRLYAYIASSAGQIDWSPDPDAAAFTFNPG